MKSALNTFSNGIILDYNEIMTPLTALFDALNATLLTGNGNEMALQNDMGNSKIEDAHTGLIMALRDGFIPVGMKEHGSILYIASYNPHTKESQLGSIPAPYITYLAEIPKETAIEEPLTYNRTTPIQFKDLIKDPIKISNHVFHVGDKFLPQFYIDCCKEDLNSASQDKYIIRLDGDSTKYFPYITRLTYPDNTEPSDLNKIGYYKLKLFVEIPGQSFKEFPVDYNKLRLFQLTNSSVVYSSNRWFINSLDILPIDTNYTEGFLSYPNIPDGTLYIQLVPEYPTDFKGICTKYDADNTFEDFINFYYIPLKDDSTN